MIEELSQKIWSHEEFHAEAAQLREYTLRRRYLSEAVSSFPADSVVRLLKSAAVLSSSQQPAYRQMAFSIATAAAEIESDGLVGIRPVLLLVLNRIGNFPALSFAENHFGIDMSALPVRLVAEGDVRTANNTVSLASRSVALTDFQLKLWRDLEISRTLSISAPTSAGKSFVLQAYARKIFLSEEVRNIAFLVPTRALINQVSEEVTEWLKNDGKDGELVTTPIPRDSVLPARAIYVLTQERLQLLQSAHPNLSFEMLIVDEAQSIGDGPRGVLLSSVVEECLERRPDTRLLFAGPNLASPEKFAKIFGRTASLLKTDEAAVIQNIIFVDVDEVNNRRARLALYAEGDKLEFGSVLFDQPLVDHKSKLVNCALLLGREGQSLIYAQGTYECEQIAFGLADTEVPPSSQLTELSAFVKEAVHSKFLLGQSVLKGVGYHYGRLPSLVRKAVEDAFSEGHLRYLVTTSTLLYGVNLPAQNLFMHNPQRGQNKPITPNDFWNLAGRAGRLGKEFSGNVFLIDYKTWPTDPMAGSKDREIVPAIESHLITRGQELLDYILDENTVPQRDKPDELENTFVKLVKDFYEGKLESTLEKVGLPASSDLALKLRKAVEASVDGKAIDRETLLASPTVSVHRQQSLYERLEASLKRNGPAYIIPKHPRDSDAYNSYAAVFCRCHGSILKYPKSDRSHRFFALIALRWMRGEPLPQIIDASYDYQLRIGQSPNIASVIRTTLSQIERDLRFKYVRLMSCYNAVLELLLKNRGMGELASSIPALPMYLELGACSPTMISFMGLGLSRFTASRISSLARRDNMSQPEARQWIRSRDTDSLPIPSASIREIKRMIVGGG